MECLTGACSAIFGSDRPMGCLARPAQSSEIRDLASGDRV
jgi:hypothetical protein